MKFNSKILLIIIIIILGASIFWGMDYLIKQKEEAETKESSDKKNEPNYDNKEEIDDDKQEIKEFKIYFDSNGGSQVKSLTIKEGDKINKPENPTRDGYTFVEWTLNDKAFDFETLITEDIILKATWSKKEASSSKTTTTTTSPATNNKKAESTIDKINLNDYPTTTIDYKNYTQPVSYYFITNLESVFPSLAGKTYITLSWEEDDPVAEGYDLRINEWYAAFDKLTFDTTKENKAKEALANIKNKKYKGIKFETNIGTIYTDREKNIDYNENHAVDYKYEYLTIPKKPLTTLYTGIENVRKDLNKEISSALSGAITVVYPGYGVYGKWEAGILNEEMCQEYNFVCDRW